MAYYPVSLDVKDRRVVVVGGGRVAERKVKQLLSFGASVKVIAPSLTPLLSSLARTKKIRYEARLFRTGDLSAACLAIAATSDRKANERVAREARKRDIWVNVVDCLKACDFIAPAVVRRRGLVIAVTTDGKNPPLSKSFKEFLEGAVDVFVGRRGQS
ncbi:MAG: NAD(P)-dependent oxidoreductase [Candidatus Omnitrophota bacterium]